MDKGEIFDDARVVMLLIPCLDALYIVARETAAFVTETNFIISKEVAAFLKRAFVIAGVTPRAIRYAHPLAFYIVFASKVPAAHRAVHTARRYDFYIIVHFHRKKT